MCRSDLFRDLKTFALFIGYPRSGHTFVGQCLNAREDTTIAHEFHALGKLRDTPTSFRRLCLNLLARNQYFCRKLNFQWESYGYAIRPEMQLKSRKLVCLGDKKAAATTSFLQQDGTLAQRLQELSGLNLRLLHHVRNPLDNISTISYRSNKQLREAFHSFASLVHTNRALLTSDAYSPLCHTLHHEDLLADPRTTLAGITQFLDLDRDEAWETACMQSMHKSASRSRYLVPWTVQDLESVAALCRETPFLNRYTQDVEAFQEEVASGRFECAPGARQWHKYLRTVSLGRSTSEDHQAASKILEQGYGSYSQYLLLAHKLMPEDADKARPLLAKSIELNPWQNSSRRLQAKLCLENKDEPAARRLLTLSRLIAAGGKDQFLLELSLLQLGAGQGEAALESVRQAIALAPKAPYTWFRLCMLLEHQGDLDGADEALDKVLELAPAVGRYRLQRSLLHSRRGRAAQALEQMLLATHYSPRNASMQVRLAVLHKAAGDRAAAEQALSAALELDPQLSTAHFLLTTILDPAQAAEKILEHMRAAVAGDPTHSHYQHGLGALLLKMGDAAGARQALEQALELTPKLSATHHLLAGLHSRAGHRDQALSHARAALALQPDSPMLARSLDLLQAAPGAQA